MTVRFDVAVVGEIYVDHIFSGFPAWPLPGEEVTTDAYTREMGGGTIATACGLARLGRKVGVVGLIGADDRAWFEQRLAGYGVAFDGIRIGDGFTGTTISISTPQDRSFFTHIGVNSAVGALAMGDGLATLCAAAHVHFAMPVPHTVAQVVLPLLAERGITTSLDMGYQPEWLASPLNRPTITQVDYLMPNEKEAELLFGSTDVGTYFDHAARIGIRNPLLKLGARGAAALDNGEIVHVRPPVVQAVDATGAGDAFDAGFIDALLDAAPLRRRLERGCITGALSTRKPGALGGIPDAQELWTVHDRNYALHD